MEEIKQIKTRIDKVISVYDKHCGYVNDTVGVVFSKNTGDDVSEKFISKVINEISAIGYKLELTRSESGNTIMISVLKD